MRCPFLCQMDDEPAEMRVIVRRGHTNAMVNLYGGVGVAPDQWEVRQCPVCGFTARFTSVKPTP